MKGKENRMNIFFVVARAFVLYMFEKERENLKTKQICEWIYIWSKRAKQIQMHVGNRKIKLANTTKERTNDASS